MSKNSDFPAQKFPPDDVNQDAPSDFSQDAGDEFSQDSGYDDTLQYEMPSPTQPQKKPTIVKKNK